MCCSDDASNRPSPFCLQIDGYRVLQGDETAPVLLTLTNALSEDEKAVEIQKSFRKDTTVGEIKVKSWGLVIVSSRFGSEGHACRCIISIETLLSSNVLLFNGWLS